MNLVRKKKRKYNQNSGDTNLSVQDLDRFWEPNGIYAWKTISYQPFECSTRDIARRVLFGWDSVYTPSRIGKREEAVCRSSGFGRAICEGEEGIPFNRHYYDDSLFLAHLMSDIPFEPTRNYNAFPCGFYAFKLDHEPNWLKDDLYRSHLAFVKLDGKIVEHEFGYRASHQTIIEIGPEVNGVDLNPRKGGFTGSSIYSRWRGQREVIQWIRDKRKECYD